MDPLLASPARGSFGKEPAISFRRQVIALVRLVPRGKLVSYGQVARVLGRPRAARIVGGVMSSLGPEDLEVPWHRVLNRRGGISPRSDPFSDRDPVAEQAGRLLAEGLRPQGDGFYDLSRHGLTDLELASLVRRALSEDLSGGNGTLAR